MAPSTPSISKARLCLALLLVINLFNYVDRQVLAAVVPKIQEELHCNDAQTGLLNTAFIVSYMVLAGLFGWLGDRFNRWVIVAIGVSLWSLASGASGLAATFTALLLTRCFVGVGEAAYGPVAPALISDLFPMKDRGRVMSWFYMAIPIGSALGYMLGGFMSANIGWRWAFYSVVPPGLILGALCLFMPEPARGAADTSTSPRKAGWKDYAILLKTPSYVLDTLGMTAMTFAIGGVGFWIPKYIQHDRYQGQMDLDKVNMIFGAMVVVAGFAATLLGGITGDWLRKRFGGAYFLVSAAGLLASFPCFIAMIYTPFPLAWLWIFLAVFCLFFNTGPANTILANVTHPSMRGTAFALNILIIHALGDAISPAVMGMISDHCGGLQTAFLAVAGLILVGGFFWLWGACYLQRDTELAATRLV